MSFFSYKNQGNQRCPKRIGTDEMNRIIERVCLQVKKVYDSCLQQITLEDVTVCLRDVEPGNFDYPLTFTGCRSIGVKGKLVDTKIERLEERPHFARVRTKVLIPIEVTFEDENGKKGTGRAVIEVPKDVILYVPDESVIPFFLESIVSAVCASGAYIGPRYQFTIDVCVTIILKIVAEVELLVPSFGFCDIPPCEEFAENVCDEFFRRPLFPPQLEDILDNPCNRD